MVFMIFRFRFSHTQSCGFTGFHDTRKFWFDLLGTVSLNSLSSSSMKQIPRNFLALSSWIGNDSILLSASKIWLWVQRDGSIWSFLTWTRNHLSLHRHPELSHEVVKKTLLILQKNLRDLLLELGSRITVGVLCSWSLPESLIRSFAAGKILHFLEEISPLSHRVFMSRFLTRPSFPTPQSLQPVRHPSKFSPRTNRIRRTIQVRLSF